MTAEKPTKAEVKRAVRAAKKGAASEPLFSTDRPGTVSVRTMTGQQYTFSGATSCIIDSVQGNMIAVVRQVGGRTQTVLLSPGYIVDMQPGEAGGAQ